MVATPVRAEFGLDVIDFGARGDGTTDDAAAIAAAYAAVPSTGGTLVFQDGTYLINTPLSFTAAKPIAVRGSGTIKVGFASGDAITINGPATASVSDLTFTPGVTRNASSYYLKIVGVGSCLVRNVYALVSGPGGGLWLSGCNSARVSDTRFAATDGVQLRLDASGGTAVVNSSFSQGASAGSAPTCYVTGTSTSLRLTGCQFGGGGPEVKIAISGITSTASTFTVTATAHGLNANDFVVIRGASIAAYNDMWRIQSVTSNTIVVGSALNPGAASGGTVETITTPFVVSNTAGSCNESMIANCIFESGGNPTYGSAALVFNGRAKPDTTGNSVIVGWTITGCYFDYGHTGVVIQGQDANLSHQSTASGFTIGDSVFAAKGRCILLDRPQGVFIANNSGNWPAGAYPADQVSATCGLYIYSGTAPAATATGITVQGSSFGQPRDFGLFGEALATYGVILDGAGINDLVIEGNQIGGATAAFQMVNTPVAAAQRWKIRHNNLVSGTFPIANTTYLPSVASASTIDLTALPYDVIKVTGTVNIGTISGGWIGREVRLIFTGALSLVTGGNLAVAASRTILAGDALSIIYDGTSWYVR
jgi:hypothetical protein